MPNRPIRAETKGTPSSRKSEPKSKREKPVCGLMPMVASKRPIEMVVPFIKRLFSGAISEEA